MRSFASALSLSRGGRSDNAADASAHSVPAVLPHLAKARSTSLLAKAPRTPVETSASVLSRPVLTPGSSCSSDGSASLQTPEDETVMPLFPKSDGKKRWSAWFGFRKPSEKESHAGPDQTDSAPPRPLSGNKGQTTDRAPVRSASTQSSSESDEDDEQSSSESSNGPGHSTVVGHRSVPPRAMVAQARANLRTLLRNSLNRSPLPPPLVETPSTLFPKSSAPLHSPHQVLSLESTMHVRKMLWRLDHRTLSDTEVQSITSLARRPQPKEVSRNSRMERRTDDDIIAYATMRVGRYSRGLRKWASRPCFEQRFLVWMPDEKGNVSCKGVMGVDRGLAIYDLENSEGLEALAGLDLDDDTFERSLFPLPPPPPRKKPSFNTTSQSLARSAKTARKSPFQRTSSPLRIDHSTPAEPVLSTISPVSSVKTESPISPPILDANTAETSREASPSTTKVDLTNIDHSQDSAENDESIPLGYVLQAKKRREEKTRFLQAEREKRAKEIAAREVAEGQKRDAGQRRALEEQRRKEEERRRIEEEKKACEERLKEKYNEEVAASRQRRENARLGLDNYTNIREMHQRLNEQTYSRPAYDPTPPPVHLPRRSMSDVAAPGLTNGVSLNDLRPSSIAESSRDKRHNIVPSSRNLELPSSEGARSYSQYRQSVGRDTPQQAQHQYSSRPPSVVSSPSRPVSVLRTQSSPNQVPLMAYPMMPVITQMPAFVPMNQVPSLPPMPPIPVWNMPLLPPNAPFMRQPYSRSPSPGSSPHSRNHSPTSSPSRRQSTLPPPSPSHRQAGLQASSSSPSRSNNAASRPPTSPLSRVPGGNNRLSQLPSERSSKDASRFPPRSMSYPALPQSASRPMHRDDRSQSTRHGSSMNIANMDSNRRTSIM